MEEKKCSNCRKAQQTGEHEYECLAEEFDIDEKTCFVPKE